MFLFYSVHLLNTGPSIAFVFVNVLSYLFAFFCYFGSVLKNSQPTATIKSLTSNQILIVLAQIIQTSDHGIGTKVLGNTATYLKQRFTPGNCRRCCCITSLMELSQKHTGLSSPGTTTLLHDGCQDVILQKKICQLKKSRGKCTGELDSKSLISQS